MTVRDEILQRRLARTFGAGWWYVEAVLNKDEPDNELDLDKTRNTYYQEVAVLGDIVSLLANRDVHAQVLDLCTLYVRELKEGNTMSETVGQHIVGLITGG